MSCVFVFMCVFCVCTCVCVCVVCVYMYVLVLLHYYMYANAQVWSTCPSMDNVIWSKAQPSEEASSKYWQLYQYRIDLSNQTPPVLAVLQVARRFDGWWARIKLGQVLQTFFIQCTRFIFTHRHHCLRYCVLSFQNSICRWFGCH